MRSDVLAALLVGPVIFGAGILIGRGGDSSGGEPRGLTPGSAAARVEVEREELDALLARLTLLEADLEARAGAGEETQLAAPRVRLPVAGATEALAPSPESAAGSVLDPRAALAAYVASFRSGGDGLEFYRLIVEAHIPELVPDVLPLVAGASNLTKLRTRLAAMLGDSRLAGNPRVLSTLWSVVRVPDSAELAAAAATSIARVATQSDAAAVEQSWWTPHFVEPRAALLDLALVLAGDDPNPSIGRMLGTTPIAEGRWSLVGRLSPAFVDSALDPYATIRGLEQPVRLLGAQRVSGFRSPEFVRFVDSWRASEPDEAVRIALGAASEALASIPPYHYEQALGPPNVRDIGADLPEAWAPASANGGPEWLELDFGPARRASLVRIHETCAAGAIVQVDAILDDGAREVAWRGQRSGARPGVFEVPLAASRPVRGVRLMLDTARVNGWNEIDAAELVGPEGAAYATAARGSSYYGQGRRGRDTQLVRTLTIEDLFESLK